MAVLRRCQRGVAAEPLDLDVSVGRPYREAMHLFLVLFFLTLAILIWMKKARINR